MKNHAANLSYLQIAFAATITASDIINEAVIIATIIMVFNYLLFGMLRPEPKTYNANITVANPIMLSVLKG